MYNTNLSASKKSTTPIYLSLVVFILICFVPALANSAISKADATITVNGYTGVYDASPHGATGSATGIGGADLSAGLDLGATFTDVPGGTAYWTFDGGTNYNDQFPNAGLNKSEYALDEDILYTNTSFSNGVLMLMKGSSIIACYYPTQMQEYAVQNVISYTYEVGNDYRLALYSEYWGQTCGCLCPPGVFTTDEFFAITDSPIYNDQSGDVDIVISQKAASVTPDEQYKFYGDPDPKLTGTLDGFISTDEVTASYSRISGESVAGSPYKISTVLSPAEALGNYDITYNTADLEIRKITLTITAENKLKQYSDPLPAFTVVYNGFIDGEGLGDLSGTLNCVTTATVTSGQGNYPITCSGLTSSNYSINYIPGILTVDLEDAAINNNGDTFVFTAGPTITKAPIRLSAHIDQLDTNLGDLALARLTFVLIPAGGGSNITFADIPVNSSGDALTTANVLIGVYSVNVTISSGNLYWMQNLYGEGLLVVVSGSLDQRVTGGGWIPDTESSNGKDIFGFTVNYNKNGAPKGNFLYIFRGTDGYNYQLKSNSWAKGGLSFTADNKAYFSAKSTLQKINRASGEVVSSDGSYSFAVEVTDSDMSRVKKADSFAITIFKENGTIWKQIGTASSQILLGGGNIVIHSK